MVMVGRFIGQKVMVSLEENIVHAVEIIILLYTDITSKNAYKLAKKQQTRPVETR